MTKNSIDVKGLAETQKLLKDLVPRHARNLNRATVHAVAQEAAKEVKAGAPKDKGKLRKSVKTKRRKSHPDNPRSDVIFESGKSAKNDGFYWRFIEHGFFNVIANKFIAAMPFVEPVKKKFQAGIKGFYEKNYKLKLVKLIEREQKKLRGKR